MEKAKRYVANAVVSCSPEGDGSVLFNPDADDMAVINHSGEVLWAYLLEPRSIEELAAHLVASYEGLELEQARTDAQEFVDQLLGDFVLAVEE